MKYKQQILYLFFGALTTLLNIASYYIMYNIFIISNVKSTVIALMLSIAFAFITNKLWVFESRKIKSIIHELPAFLLCRILTGILDVLIMYVSVDVLSLNGIIMKIISNVIVIILNYIASKWVIFSLKKITNLLFFSWKYYFFKFSIAW